MALLVLDFQTWTLDQADNQLVSVHNPRISIDCPV